jgi:hypothetical protein
MLEERMGVDVVRYDNGETVVKGEKGEDTTMITGENV